MAVAALETDLELAAHGGRSVALASDPLRLQLPALPLAMPSAEVVRILASLWFDVQLDGAGVLGCAEWLADRRATLSLEPEDRAAVEAYAARRAAWLPRSQRELLAARLFAVGPEAPSAPDAAARFVPALAALASALVAFGPGGGLPLILDTGLSRSALRLARVIGAIASESLSASATAFTDQLRASVGVLERPGICALVGANGFWDAVRRLQGDRAPDLRRLLDQGRHGQVMLRWLADSLPALQHDPPLTAEVSPGVAGAAATWIRSCGLALREGSR